MIDTRRATNCRGGMAVAKTLSWGLGGKGGPTATIGGRDMRRGGTLFVVSRGFHWINCAPSEEEGDDLPVYSRRAIAKSRLDLFTDPKKRICSKPREKRTVLGEARGGCRDQSERQTVVAKNSFKA